MMMTPSYAFIDCTFAPSSEATSKHATRRDWPTTSISAEWIGSAYMSGSSSHFQKYSVMPFARIKATATWGWEQVYELICSGCCSEIRTAMR